MARQMLIKRLRGIGKIHRGALEKFTEGHCNIFRLISNSSKLVRLPKNPSTAKSLMSAKLKLPPPHASLKSRCIDWYSPTTVDIKWICVNYRFLDTTSTSVAHLYSPAWLIKCSSLLQFVVVAGLIKASFVANVRIPSPGQTCQATWTFIEQTANLSCPCKMCLVCREPVTNGAQMAKAKEICIHS